MKIIHNTTSKYVPNQIFDSQISTDDDYSLYKKQNKKNQLLKQNQTNLKQTFKKKNTVFTDLTNNVNKKDQISENDIKQINTSNISPEKIYLQNQNQQQKTSKMLQFIQNDSIKDSRKKNKKKVSPKKNNIIKLLMDDFQENTDQQQNQDQIRLQKIEQFKNNKILNSQHKKDQQIKDVIQYVNNKRFNLLYNDINFDSSSDQQQKDQRQQQQFSSDQSQLRTQTQTCKPKNIFEDDKQFQNSCQQSENASRNTQKSQNSPKDLIDDNNGKQKQILYINTSQFRRTYVKQDEQYLKKPLPQNKCIQFILKRDKSKRKTDYVQYYLYDSKIIKQVLYIRKTNKYQIFAKQNVQNPKAHPDLKYLTAQLETNFLGNNFSLKYINKNTSDKYLAQTVSYEINLLGLNGPRKINVYIPNDQDQKISHNENLQTLYNQNHHPKISKFINKQAKWNQEVQSYVLSMKGKAKVSSVKNFVIVKHKQEEINAKFRKQKQQQQQKNNVIFGKVDKDRFNLVVRGPFSILQGLSIALSTFDRKLTCE